jgi:hypothetical protein
VIDRWASSGTWVRSLAGWVGLTGRAQEGIENDFNFSLFHFLTT